MKFSSFFCDLFIAFIVKLFITLSYVSLINIGLMEEIIQILIFVGAMFIAVIGQNAKNKKRKGKNILGGKYQHHKQYDEHKLDSRVKSVYRRASGEKLSQSNILKH